MKKPSRYHTNRKAHNWLIYNISDKYMTSASFIHAMKTSIVYDLGAGEAPYREHILKYAKEYKAIDWENSLHNIKVDIIADLNKKLPISDNVCDTVISFSVLEHLKEPQLMLNEAFRILKPGGNIFLQVPWQWWVHEKPYDFFRYTPFGLSHLFETAGFQNIAVQAQSGFFTMMVLKFNYFTRRFVRGPLLIKYLIYAILLPVWYLGQIIAPYLDKIDRNWDYETTGYIVTAFKAK